MYTTLIRESEGTEPVNRRADLKLSIETQVHQDETKKGERELHLCAQCKMNCPQPELVPQHHLPLKRESEGTVRRADLKHRKKDGM